MVKAPIGKQDQYASTFGGFNLFSFNKDNVVVDMLDRDRERGEEITDHIVLFDTGIKRTKNLQERFKKLTAGQIETLDKIKGITHDALDRIFIQDYEGLGNLLDKAWRLKKRSNPVSTPQIDKIYRRGMDCGAWGGKLLGSGGGGYMIFMVDPRNREQFIANMDIRAVDFSICNNGLEIKDLTE